VSVCSACVRVHIDREMDITLLRSMTVIAIIGTATAIIRTVIAIIGTGTAIIGTAIAIICTGTAIIGNPPCDWQAYSSSSSSSSAGAAASASFAGMRIVLSIAATLYSVLLCNRLALWRRHSVVSHTSPPHLHGDWAHPAASAPGLGSPFATSAPGRGFSPPRLRWDWAHPRHICAGTRLGNRFRRVRRASPRACRLPLAVPRSHGTGPFGRVWPAEFHGRSG
jgi:hypothetical protein